MSRFERLDPIAYELPPEFEARLLSPALIVHMDRVRENVRRMLRYMGGDPGRWRPHVKTSKIPEVWAELARAGLRNFKCATTREAALLLEVLSAEDVEGDVLLAYPLVGPSLARLGQVAAAHPEARVSVLCEDPALVREIPDAVSIFVDVNPGMNRTGVPLEELDTVLAVARAAGERFRGVHYYDGHLHEGGPDRRRAQVHACYDQLMELLAELRAADIAIEEVITSGTPTFRSALEYAPFAELDEGTRHRVSPGTVVYHDLRTETENADIDLLPAAVVFSRVVSHPAADIVTCDAGSKAVAAEAGDPVAFVLGHPGLVARTPNEEHLPLTVRTGARPERGTGLMLVPQHICPTVNLAEEAVLMESGSVAAVVPVRARAHDLRLTDDPPAAGGF